MLGVYGGADDKGHAFFLSRRGRIITIDARGVDHSLPSTSTTASGSSSSPQTAPPKIQAGLT
jgi:hypothetical protein